MKNIILILGILFCFNPTKAQEIKLKKGETLKEFKKGTYYKTSTDLLDKFIGIWVYKNESLFFKIELKRQKKFVQGFDIYIDNLSGTYCYSDVIDCKVNENLNYIIDDGNDSDTLSKGYAKFLFHDIKYDKLGKLEFYILENGNAKMTLKNREFIFNNKEIGFSVPTNIILTKVK